MLTARELQQRGVDVVLVEKDRICSATKAHTTAKITAQHGLICQKLIRSIGTEGATNIARQTQKRIRKPSGSPAANRFPCQLLANKE